MKNSQSSGDRRFGRPGGWQQASVPDASDASDWFADSVFGGVTAEATSAGQQNANNKFKLTVKITTSSQEK